MPWEKLPADFAPPEAAPAAPAAPKWEKLPPSFTLPGQPAPGLGAGVEPTPPPYPENWRGAAEVAHQGLSGFYDKFLPILQAPGRAFNAAASFFGADPGPVDRMQESQRQTFVGDQPPENSWERMARRGGEVAGQSVPFMVAGPMAAGEVAPLIAANELTAAARGVLPPLADRIAKPIVQGMTQFAPVSDLVGAVGSGAAEQGAAERGLPTLPAALMGGAGAQLYANLFSPAHWAGVGAKAVGKEIGKRLPEGAIPGVTPGLGPYDTAMEAFQNGATDVMPKPGFVQRLQLDAREGRRSAASNAVEGQIATALKNPEAAAEAERAIELQKQYPGFRPNIAEATGDAGLLAQSRARDARMTGAEISERRANRDASFKAVTDKADSVPGGVSGRMEQPAKDPNAVGPRPEYQGTPDELAKERAGQITAEQTKAAQAPGDAARATGQAETAALPDARPADVGARVRRGYDTAEQASEAEFGRKLNAVDPDKTWRGTSGPLHDDLQNELANLGTDLTDAAMPPSLRRLLGNTESTVTPGVRTPVTDPKTGNIIRYEQTPKSVDEQSHDIDSLIAARSEANQYRRRYAAAAAQGSVDGQRNADAMTAAITAIDRQITKASQAVPGAEGRLAEANRFYREEHAPNFSRGLGDKATASRADRSPVLSDEAIAGDVLPKDNMEGGLGARAQVAQTRRVLPEGSDGGNAIHDYALTQLRGMADENGMIPPAALNKFMSEHRELLDARPELAKALKSKDQTALYKAIDDSDAAVKAVGESKLKKLLGDGEPGEAMDKALRDPATMRSFLEQSKNDPVLTQALKRSAWDRVMAAAGKASKGDTLPNPNDLSKFLDDEGLNRSLNLLTGGDTKHTQALRDIVDASRMLTRSNPKGSAETVESGASEGVRALTGQGAPAFFSKLWATFGSKRAGRAALAIDTGVRVANKLASDKANQAWDAVLDNPDVAAIVARAAKRGTMTEQEGNAITRLLRGGRDAAEKAIRPSPYIFQAPETARKGDSFPGSEGGR